MLNKYCRATLALFVLLLALLFVIFFTASTYAFPYRTPDVILNGSVELPDGYSSGLWTNEEVQLRFDVSGVGTVNPSTYKISSNAGITYSTCYGDETGANYFINTSGNTAVTKNVILMANDMNGIEYYSNLMEIKIDKKAPVIYCNNIPVSEDFTYKIEQGVTYNFTFNDEHSGINKIYVDEQLFEGDTYTSPHARPEPYIIRIKDYAGNETSCSVTVTDDAAPTLTQQFSSNNTYVSSLTTTLIASDNDVINPSSYKVSIGDELFGLEQYNYELVNSLPTIYFTEEGEYYITSSVSDMYGNTTLSSTQAHYIIDATPPTCNYLSQDYYTGTIPLAPITFSDTYGISSATLNGTDVVSGVSLPVIGQNTIEITDLAGNKTSINAVIYDDTAPIITLDTSYSGIYNSIFTISGTVTDNIEIDNNTFTVKNNNNDLSYTIEGNNFTIDISADGEYLITISVSDTSGNTGAATATFALDTALPATNITNNSTYLLSSSVIVEFIDPVINNYSSQISTALLTNNSLGISEVIDSDYLITQAGEYKLVLADTAGNESITEFTVTDDINPIISAEISSPQDYAGQWANSHAIITLNAEDETAIDIGSLTVSGVVDYEVEQVNQNTGTVTINDVGSNQVYLTIDDTSGNTASSETFDINIDKATPVSNIINGSVLQISDAPIIEFGDEQSGIASAALNGTEILSGYVIDRPGLYNLDLTDLAGNNTKINFAVKDENTVTLIGYYQDDAYSGQWTNNSQTVVFEVVSDIEAFDVLPVFESGNGTVESVSETGAQITFTDDGEHSVYLTANDGQGNTFTSNILEVKIDTQAPTISLTDGEGYNINQLPNVRITDNLSGIATATLNGLPIADGETLPQIVGDHVLTVKDNAGNETAVSFYIYEPNPPVITGEIIYPTTYTGILYYSNQNVTIRFNAASSNGINPSTYQISTDNGISWNQATTSSTILDYTLIDEGSYQVKAKVSDNGSHPQTAESEAINIGIDKTLPITNITNNTVYEYDKISITASDPTSNGVSSGIQTILVDDKRYTDAIEPGTHVLKVIDNANNITIKTFTVSPPKPPTITHTVTSPAGYSGGTGLYTSSDVNVKFNVASSAKIDYSSFAVSLQNGSNYTAFPLSDSNEFSGIIDTEGTTKIVAKVSNVYGVYAYTQPLVINIDKTAPTSNYINNEVYNAKSLSYITFKDTAGSGIELAYLNGNAIFTGKSKPIVGKNTLVITDKAGNSSTINFEVVADPAAEIQLMGKITSPTSYTGGEGNWTNKDTTVKFEATGGKPPENAYQFSVDSGATWQNATGTTSGYTTKITEEGTYTTMTKTANSDGVISLSNQVIVNIDKTQPQSNIINSTKYNYGDTVKLDFYDKGGSGLVNATLNGMPVQSGDTVTTTGSYTLKLTDNAGNSSSVKFSIASSSTKNTSGSTSGKNNSSKNVSSVNTGNKAVYPVIIFMGIALVVLYLTKRRNK